jgi:tetratricopeptide (TPR) repeat protein
MKILFPISLILIAFAPAKLFAQQRNTNELMRRANSFYYLRQADSAIFYCNKAIAIYPFAAAYILRGRCYIDKLNYNQAVIEYTKALGLEPGNDSAYYYRATANQLNKDYHRAIADFTKLISINPRFLYAYNGRGNAYTNVDSNYKAIEDYSTALQLDPKNAYTYYLNRGDAYFNTENYDQAIDNYRGALMINRNSAECYYSIGKSLNVKKNYDSVLAYFNKAIELDPGYKLAYLGRGNVYRYKGNYDLAIKEYTKAIALDPNLTNAYNNRGLANKNKGNYEKAIADYKASLAIEPFYKYALLNILPCLIRLGRFEEAASYYLSYKTKKLNGYIEFEGWEYYKFYLEAATENVRLGNYKEALDQLHIAEIKYNSITATKANVNADAKDNYADVLALKGFILEKLNQPDDAAVSYDQALVFNINQPEVNEGLKKTKKFRGTEKTKPVVQNLGIPNLDNAPRYHAILIAEQKYSDPAIGNLTKPIEDALKLKHLLETKYTFSPRNIDTLFNKSREDVLGAIIQKCNTLKYDDNLLIFYSGHGTADKDQFGNTRGYLVPSSARKENLFTYISFSDLVTALGRGDTRHILFITDACFSGALTKEIPKDAPVDAKLAYASMSRKMMTSGNLEPVPDNSIFLYYLLKKLGENNEKYLTADKLFSDFIKAVELNSNTKPQYSTIRDTGDEGGDFVFIKK